MLNISIPINEEQDKKLKRWILKYNRQRARNHQPEFASYQDAIRQFVIRKLRDCARSASVSEARDIHRKFVDLTEDQQERIKAIVRE